MQRNRLLPRGWWSTYFVLAMCLFSGQSYEEVARLPTVGLQGERRRASWAVLSDGGDLESHVSVGCGAAAAVVRAGVSSGGRSGHCVKPSGIGGAPCVDCSRRSGLVLSSVVGFVLVGRDVSDWEALAEVCPETRAEVHELAGPVGTLAQ